MCIKLENYNKYYENKNQYHINYNSLTMYIIYNIIDIVTMVTITN